MSPLSQQHTYAFDLIWSQLAARQNRHSSTWWFFLLFPEGPQGYGPRQLMFTVAARADKQVRVNDTWLPAMDLARPVRSGVDHFPALAVGWYFDGQMVHEALLNEVATATLSATDQTLRCWADGSAAAPGCEFRATVGPAPGMEATIRGSGIQANFSTWGDLDSKYTAPDIADDSRNPLGNVHFVAWRRMHFAGDFDLPGGRERLEGLGYFQRVCMNMPLIPWKWIWALFPDGTLFSSFVPYAGLNLTRGSYRFFSRNRLEQATISVRQSAYWQRPGTTDETLFDQVTVLPLVEGDGHPHFLVTARNGQGDWLSFRAASGGHAGFGVHRPVAGPLRSHWHYNEYMFRVADLEGAVGGEPISTATQGQGFGNLEYTWGLGL